ncbi:transmembrane protein, putative [Medicago truncatula]|uniref:Transmembrane protein, putative n=1 Tax=Medicago truncatula TaxID=3880 RepID=G7K9Q3_MEDTR|nr:transmembrane protein, putative [Medicago truncatula]
MATTYYTLCRRLYVLHTNCFGNLGFCSPIILRSHLSWKTQSDKEKREKCDLGICRR